MKKIIKNKGAVYCSIYNWNPLISKIEELNPSKVFILVDENTKKYCLPYFQDVSPEFKQINVLEIPEGEINKNITTCSYLWNQLSIFEADRHSLLINLGGGVITDLGGFVASTFKRGISFINVPTTLLSMVDASVGGKTGVDLGLLKNQIGVINNPELVMINSTFLNTLTKKQILSGYAEMLKHGLINSHNYWNQLKSFKENNITNIEDLLWESILIKNDVITIDPFEKNIRKSLNFGHTLGHAIESYSLENNNINPLLHGEAIAVGMILTCYISNKTLNFPNELLNDVSNHILKKFSKILFTDENITKIIELLKYDKKNYNGKVLFVLLEDIGKTKLNCEVSNNIIKDAFEYYKNL